MAGSGRFPEWIRFKAPGSEGYRHVKDLVSEHNIHTICQSALCPNIGECWGRGTATFMILGDICTRACRYCHVTSARPNPLDFGEPDRVARAVKKMNLKHAVVTSVNRDDVPDGGASIFARTIELVHEMSPGTTIEVLIPDFDGNMDAVRVVLEAGPDILNHNIETVPRIFKKVRARGDFQLSLDILWEARRFSKELPTKSGIIVGMGEEKDEVIDTMRALRDVDCEILTIGQYLQPSAKHLKIARFYAPAEFAELRDAGLAMGFRFVESGPHVRSSYRAESHIQELKAGFHEENVMLHPGNE